VQLRYPYLLYSCKIRHAPLFKVDGEPFQIDLSVDNDELAHMDITNQKAFQKQLEALMQPRHSWGIGGYLERRDSFLSQYPQMVDQRRFYHLGLDIAVSLDAPLHAPLDAVVVETGYEEGQGNYGGYVILKHDGNFFETFYSFYGHLNPDIFPVPGRIVSAGEPFARVGDFHQNGFWYYHTHLQILTREALEKGYAHKGYCAESDLPFITRLCPDPLPLFKR
jgi:murein DD-endopeptidase MepM/ murein hydrolase activator NlpD